MKTIKIYAMLTILTMCSCEKYSTEVTQDNRNKDSNVSIELPQDGTVKKTCQKVSFGFFKDNEKVGAINQNAADADFGTIHLNLVSGIYQVGAIGHNGISSCTITSPEKITFTSNKVTDTFYYYGTLEVKSDESTSEVITLQRAVAMFRLTIKDDIPENAKKIKFYYTGGSSTLNAVTGYGCVNSKQTEIIDIKPEKKTYEVYTFPHADGKKLNMTISVLDENDFTIASTNFTDVQVTKNYITTYSGKLFTKTSEGSGSIKIEFEFNPEWAGETKYNF